MNVLCGALLALAATAADPAPEQAALAKTTPYYPMKVGTSWSYKSGDSKFTLAVTKIEKVGVNWCARIETRQGDAVVGSEDVYVGDDGVYRAAVGDKPLDGAVLILKLPPAKNVAWSIDSTAETKTGKESLRGTFTELDAGEVAVPAGKYPTTSISCQDLDANGARYSFTTWYAEGVGMVKQKIDAGGLSVVIELEKFEAPK